MRHTAADPSERTQTRRVRVIGVDPNGRRSEPARGVGRRSGPKLNTPGTALYDRKSRPHPDQVNHPGESVFGKLEPGTKPNSRADDITLVGGFDLGFDFGTDGSLIVSDRTFADWVREPLHPPGSSARRGRSRSRCGSSRVRIAAQVQAALQAKLRRTATMSMC